VGQPDHGINILSARDKLRLIAERKAHLHLIAWNKVPGNCVLIKAMKKLLLIGCLILTTACASPLGDIPATASLTPSPTSTLLPTPIPATATPTPLPTLALSPTPFPRFFTEEFDSSLAGWTILQAGNEGTPSINNENSHLILQMDFPFTWLYALYGVQEYSNIRIDVQFENRALTPAGAGLICRYSDDAGWFEYNVLTDGSYNVLYGRWLSVGIAEYLPIMDGVFKEIQPSGAIQKIGLICSDATLSLFINETLIRRADVSRYELTEGQVGVAASSYENTPIVIGIDSVTISEP